MKNERGANSLKSLPFDERAEEFKNVIKGLTLGIPDLQVRQDFESFGHLVIELHRLSGEEKNNFEQEKIDPALDNLRIKAKDESLEGQKVRNALNYLIDLEFSFF